MSSSGRAIPVYNQACLATDSSRQQKSFYLTGSPSPGNLTISYFNSPSAPDYSLVATQADQSAWSPELKKLCFVRPNQQTANPGIYVIQFGSGTTFMALAQTNNIVSDALAFAGIGFQDPKLFAWTGKHEEHDMFTVSTNITISTNNTISKPNIWGGVRLDFTNITQSLKRLDVENNPVDYNQAMLAVGTYGTYNTTTSQGYITVFDRSGRGQIQTADGNLQPFQGANMPLVQLGIPSPVNMNGIVLTESDIPITMGNTAYILSKADNGSTVIYSITPNVSSTLNRVYVSGKSLPFSKILAASALNSEILTYSSTGAVASFNAFDLATNTWSGDNLVLAPVTDPNSTSSTSIGAIIGGVVGGFLVIALAVFFLIRRRRWQSAQKNADSAELAKLNSDENKNAEFGAGYVQYDPGYIQYDHGYVPYDQGYVQYDQQQQGYPLSPTFFPPPPTPAVNQDLDESYKVDAADSATNNPYVSPTPYRHSISRLSESPESVLAASAKSSAIQGPQYVPNSTAAASDARSPQAVTR